MGFFEGLRKGLAYDAVDAYNDIDDANYRERGLENAPSNNGWYKCVRCGKSFRKGDIEIDHIIPVNCGGSNRRENLQCMCRHCNASKQDSTIDTKEDLKRRKKELDQQDKEDRKYLKELKKHTK